MIEQRLRSLLEESLRAVAADLDAGDPPQQIELTKPPQKQFGDFSTNVALGWAALLNRKPRDLAAMIVDRLPQADFVSSTEVAGPGFVNFHVTHAWLHDVLRDVVAEGDRYAHGKPTGLRVQVEFVSANPTGPLHIGHARNAALGDALASVLQVAGHTVEREYYYNDGGRQMEMFARSVVARFLQLHELEAEVPDDGYRGEYVQDIAREIDSKMDFQPPLEERPPEQQWQDLYEPAVAIMLANIEATLRGFGIVFDSFLTERSLEEAGLIDEAIDRMRRAGFVYKADGAVWFRATDFGDDKDRVLIRSNEAPTYFAKDCAYLINKFSRGFDRLVYVWGADHHGDMKRVRGAAQALGYDPDAVDIVLYQFVTFTEGGSPVRMSKRTGAIITLDELIEEVGADAARFTLLMRSHDTTFEFDLEEVKRQSLDNPVYYVQYAHARIASILRRAEQSGVALEPVGQADLARLETESELDLLRRIAELPEEIQIAAKLRAPYRLTRYAQDLAAEFHRFYTECRVVTDDAALTQARLWLCVAAKQVIGKVLGVLGVSAPEAMERADEGPESQS